MVRRTYVGVGDPVRRFEELRPYVRALRAMQFTCKPFGRDYLAIAIALDGLDIAAYHFTRQPHFYSLSTRPVSAPPDDENEIARTRF